MSSIFNRLIEVTSLYSLTSGRSVNYDATQLIRILSQGGDEYAKRKWAWLLRTKFVLFLFDTLVNLIERITYRKFKERR